MGQRNSLQDGDGVVWQTGSLPLGTTGLDLRTPIDPAALSELLNARFQDERTVLQRDGHRAVTAYDGSDVAALGSGFNVTGAWVLGHGATVSGTPSTDENEHHPWPGLARGVWDFDGSQIVWSGDRVVVARADDYFLGSSAFWNRNTAGAALKRGLPAYLPLQTDAVPPITGLGSIGDVTFVETCLTASSRVVVSIDQASNTVALDTMDRSGTLINHTVITATAPVNPRVMMSGSRLIATYMDANPGALMLTYWTGQGWSTPQLLSANVTAYECAVVVDGVHFLFSTPTALGYGLSLGKLNGVSAGSFPYPWGTQIAGTTSAPVSIAVGIAPDTSIGLVYFADGNLSALTYVNNAGTLTQVFNQNLDSSFDPFGGLTICSRGLRNASGEYEWLVHYKRANSTDPVCIKSFYPLAGATSVLEQRFNTKLVSKSFRVGDEVFVWATDLNAHTLYMLGGHYQAQTCGYADREVGLGPTSSSTTAWLHQVLPDPLTSGDLTGPYTIAKLSGVDGYDSVAESQLLDGDASITATAIETNKFRWLGLSTARTTAQLLAGTFEYGIRLRDDSTYDILEGGAVQVSATAYSANDVFSIARTGTTVTYSKNGTVVRTTTATTAALQGVALFYGVGATLASVYIKQNGAAVAPAWVSVGTTISLLSSGYGATATGAKFSWARQFNTGQTYARAGNVRVGDMDFLPSLSTAAYGKGVYISGSAVRCWDGAELGDAGFQSFPLVRTMAAAIGGSLGTGDYLYRVYAVRYTKQGERFESAALTSAKISVIGPKRVTLTINTLPCTNHRDVVLEVYRTEADGTTYYYDGSVSNNMAAASVTYVSTIDDATLRTQEGDPHATGVGQAQDIETFGPIGCAILANSGDRLWGAGGQVPAGVLQFSKLHNDGFGAGFDDLAGYEEVDTEGGVITSIIRSGDTTVALEKDRLFTIGGVGPDNFGSGQFGIPEIVLSDGAITHLGTILTAMGSVYWGDGGPRLLTPSYQVVNISIPVRPLTKTLMPTGVRFDAPRQEVIWYTADGHALLWNFMEGNSRWARWSGLNVAAVSATALATTDGRLLYPSETAAGDGGEEFEFKLRTGLIQPDKVIGGGMKIRATGITGTFQGPHEVRARLYYDGSQCWSEEWTWQPQVGTYLALVSDHGDLTPAQIDALKLNNQSGSYIGHTRTKRNECAYVQMEISNKGAAGPTFTPTEITLEIGVAPGLARTNPNSYGS